MTYTPHRFSPLIAKVYSLPAAIIFHYIWLRCGRGSGSYTALTVDELAAQYPYLSRTAIWEALQLLVMPRKTPAVVSRSVVNGVYHYGIIPHDKDYSTYLFDACRATELGTVPAIILASIGYWVQTNWKEKAEQAVYLLKEAEFADHRALYKEALARTFRGAAHTTTIDAWVTRHSYISARTARRGFSCLLKADLLQKRPGKQHKTIYTLSRKLLVDYANKLLKLSEIENSAAKSEYRPANSERFAAKSEQEQGLSDCAKEQYVTPIKAHIEASPVVHGDAFAPPSLADARSVARSASIGENFSEQNEVPPGQDNELPPDHGEDGIPPRMQPDEHATFSSLNQPGYPRRKKHSKQKRSYVRHPKPDDPGFDLYVDDLSPAEREKYLDRFR